MERVVAGASLREVCEGVEDEIRRLGGGIAFPVQTSRNEVAAHYCPGPQEETLYADGDLAKLDIGVHVDGYVVDTAETVNVGGSPENERLVAAARAALERAITEVRAGVEVRQISRTIEKTILAHGVRPMRNLCGHGVGRWTVHCPPPIPNSPDGDRDRLASGAVVALEPFCTDGLGWVVETGEAEVFRVDPLRIDGVPGLPPELLECLRDLKGLPFARRQLPRLGGGTIEDALRVLRARGVLAAYPPLAERSGRRVAQAEHTLYVGAEGAEVLTL